MTRSKSIAKYCVECSGDSPKEVTLCHLFDCPLWSYRFGNSPKNKNYKIRIKKAKVRFPEEFKELSKMGINIAKFDL